MIVPLQKLSRVDQYPKGLANRANPYPALQLQCQRFIGAAKSLKNQKLPDADCGMAGVFW